MINTALSIWSQFSNLPALVPLARLPPVHDLLAITVCLHPPAPRSCLQCISVSYCVCLAHSFHQAFLRLRLLEPGSGHPSLLLMCHHCHALSFACLHSFLLSHHKHLKISSGLHTAQVVGTTTTFSHLSPPPYLCYLHFSCNSHLTTSLLTRSEHCLQLMPHCSPLCLTG